MKVLDADADGVINTIMRRSHSVPTTRAPSLRQVQLFDAIDTLSAPFLSQAADITGLMSGARLLGDTPAEE